MWKYVIGIIFGLIVFEGTMYIGSVVFAKDEIKQPECMYLDQETYEIRDCVTDRLVDKVIIK